MADAPLTWPELAAQLYDKLTGRGAEVTYEFENLEVYVPDTHTTEPTFARWKLNGVLRIRTRDLRQG